MPPRSSWALRLLRCALLVRLSTAVGQGNPTVYCVALVTPGGYEPHLLAGQHELKAGIFECDDFAIVSNVTADVLLAGHGYLLEQIASKVYMIDTNLFSPMVRGPPGFDPSSPKEKGKKGEEHLANTPVFLHFWKAILDVGEYKKYTYTVKVDIDTVLLPDRLSTLLHGRPVRAEYFLNTDKDMYGNFLHGPIEIMSKDAMVLFSEQSKDCEAKISKLAYGEDFWMNNCLKELKVEAVSGLHILYDMYSYGEYAQKICSPLRPDKVVDKFDISFPAYHPYKDFRSWMQCRMQAEPTKWSGDKQQKACAKADKPIPKMKAETNRLFSVFRDVQAGRRTAPVMALFLALSGAIILAILGVAKQVMGVRIRSIERDEAMSDWEMESGAKDQVLHLLRSRNDPANGYSAGSTASVASLADKPDGI